MRDLDNKPWETLSDWYGDDELNPTCPDCDCNLEEYKWLERQFGYCPECGCELLLINDYYDLIEEIKDRANDLKLMELMGK